MSDALAMIWIYVVVRWTVRTLRSGNVKRARSRRIAAIRQGVSDV